MTYAHVGVVVVAYRSAALIALCLEGILADPGAECVVVDNSGEPETADIVASVADHYGGRVAYLDPGANLGYSRACNLGVQSLKSDVDFVAIVNPDVQLEVKLSQLLASSDLPQDWTILSGCLATDGASTGCSNARPLVTIGREVAKALRGHQAYRLTQHVDPGAYLRVGQLDGALMILRSADWSTLGGFDERFELYYEDVDLCARANALAGCWIVGRRWGHHKGGASFSTSGGRAFIALRVSRLRYLRKWFGVLGVAVALFVAVLEWISRTVGQCPESASDRASAIRATIEEMTHPGSVIVLEGGRG